MELFASLPSNPRQAAFVEGRLAKEKNGLKMTRSGEMQSLCIFFWDLLISNDRAWMEICSRGLLMLTRCSPSIYRGLSLHGNTFLQEPPGRERLDIVAVRLGKKTQNIEEKHRGKFFLSSPFLARKARTSACCISWVGNQLLRDFCWEICALWNSCQGQRGRLGSWKW